MYARSRPSAAYGAFRRDLRKTFDKMATRKFQTRSGGAANTAIPAAFRSFCSSLVMGMKYEGSTPKKWVEYAVNTLSREDSETALRFLNRIADRNYDAAQLQQLWDGCVSDFGLWFKGDLRAFLLRIRSEMAKLVRPTVNRRHSRR